MAPQSDITLYTTQTPNGIKISILLEELGCVHSPPPLPSLPPLSSIQNHTSTHLPIQSLHPTDPSLYSLPYKVHKIDFSSNEQKEPWFLEINPNGRIPALTDRFEDGETIRVFESGSIMQYLVGR